MNKYIKSVLISIYLFVFISSTKAQVKYDIFPLHQGMHYSYNFFQVDSAFELQIYFFLLNSDSGKVEYIINDSLNYSDTLTVWSIEQRSNLLHIYQFGNDTVSYEFINDTSYYQLYEYLSGEHELKCSSMVWYLPLNVNSPNWYGTYPDSSVYRYYDSPEKLNLLSYTGCSGYMDTIWFSNKAGMYRRVTTTYSACGISKGTYNLFVERIDIPDRVKMDKSGSINEFKLSQNYPNPFNPSTTIRYRIPETGLVTLKVYDILGKEVATLVNEEKLSGSYEVEFDGSNLTSGVYFYSMQAGDFIDTKKFVLIK